MMFLQKLFTSVLCAGVALSLDYGSTISITAYDAAPLQDIVTWDSKSVFVHGERIMLFNGEFHPYRLPVPSLWLDVFQKLKSAGFAGVSFYTNWALLEGKEGEFTAEGVFNFDDFFAAAKQAGIYLVARPGPYINAEVAGGGFPGWLAHYKAKERTYDYLNLTMNYVKNMGEIIAKAQITNGGPVILVQPENEYTYATSDINPFPDKTYFQAVEDQLRAAGIVVPYVSNDAAPKGYFAPGTGNGSVDIYGHDGYPLGFDCANPYTWPDDSLPTNYLSLHRQQSPNTPYTISEFQGGSFDPWGGPGFAKCTALLGPEFERVFYKNNYAADITIFNLYMVYGGTNWGNLGHPGGYTSYDYGAIIAEDRTVSREKYSELKLQANFFKVSPAYLTSNATYSSNGSYVNNPAIATARLGNTTKTTQFFITRHSAYNSLDATEYKLEIPTSVGNLTIPQLQGSLSLYGRDSKVHVVDYKVGKFNVLYSTAEVFTWKQYNDKTVLIVYGGPGETHEIAIDGQSKPSVIDGSDVRFDIRNKALVANWEVSSSRKVLKFASGLYIYLLDRHSAYNYWTVDLPQPSPADSYTTSTTNLKSIIVNGGYLLRNGSVKGNVVSINGDLNATTTIEIIGGAPANSKLTFNGKPVSCSYNKNGVLTSTIKFVEPDLKLPALSKLAWRYIDSLPEIQSTYDDSKWPKANRNTTNSSANKTTPYSLFGQDYDFWTGAIITRGHFTANGKESTLSIGTQGGFAYANSIYLNSTLVGGFPGSSTAASWIQNITLPRLSTGKKYTLTVVTDTMGLEEDFTVGSDTNKSPRGILNYTLTSRPASDISWRMTGNLGGQDYQDKTRGPLNEGGLYAERQGYHLPKPPSSNSGWKTISPFQGISSPGVGFFTASFDLDMPRGYDIPISFVFTNSSTAQNFRAQLFVNGYQFGKYVNNIGPQTSFPVPEGILNYHGANYIALSLWGFDKEGNKLAGLELKPDAVIQSGYGTITNSPAPVWTRRVGAY